jgi:hypothetical protein
VKYFQVSRDRAGKVRRVRILHDMGRKPSIIWNRDDDYDRPRFRIGWLPYFRLAWYPHLVGPIRFTIAGRKGEIQNHREYRRRLGLKIAGLDRARLESAVRRTPL